MSQQIQLSAAQQYELGVMLKRQSPYMEYPAHVHMETLSQCNAACNFCPYPTLERKGVKMEDTLVEKIIRDLQDVPRHVNFQLSPFKVNEPFLDKRLFDILDSINTRLPSAGITLTSNATPITVPMLEKLAKVRNLLYLWVSFNDHRKDEYERVMKLPYRRTIERLDMLQKFKAEGKLPLRIVLSRVGTGTKEDMEFCRWVQQNYPLFEVSVFPRGAWLGQAADAQPTTEVPNLPCERWFELSITSTGDVAHCCMDGQAKYSIGNVRDNHVLEVYNAPHYRALRERTVSRRHVSPCDSCNFT